MLSALKTCWHENVEVNGKNNEILAQLNASRMLMLVLLDSLRAVYDMDTLL